MTTTPEMLPHESGCAGVARFAWSDCPCGVLRRSVSAARAQPCTHADAERLREALVEVLSLGHIQDDGPSLCMCKVHQRARAALDEVKS